MALEIKPDDVEAHNSLAPRWPAGVRSTEAIVHYRKALEIKPDHVEAHNNLDGVGRPGTGRGGDRALPDGPENQARLPAAALQPRPRVGRPWNRSTRRLSITRRPSTWPPPATTGPWPTLQNKPTKSRIAKSRYDLPAGYTSHVAGNGSETHPRPRGICDLRPAPTAGRDGGQSRRAAWSGGAKGRAFAAALLLAVLLPTSRHGTAASSGMTGHMCTGPELRSAHGLFRIWTRRAGDAAVLSSCCTPPSGCSMHSGAIIRWAITW